jgi:hypothetical protein
MTNSVPPDHSPAEPVFPRPGQHPAATGVIPTFRGNRAAGATVAWLNIQGSISNPLPGATPFAIGGPRIDLGAKHPGDAV